MSKQELSEQVRQAIAERRIYLRGQIAKLQEMITELDRALPVMRAIEARATPTPTKKRKISKAHNEALQRGRRAYVRAQRKLKAAA